MKTRIEIDTKTFVRFWLVVIGFVFAILAVYSARSALTLLGIAFFLALALNAPVTYIATHLPGKSRVGGTAIAYVFVLAMLGIFAFLIAPPIVQQTAKFSETVPGLIDGVTTQWAGVNSFVEKYHLEPQVENAIKSVKDSSAHWASSLGANIVSGVSSVASTFASAVLVLVLTFLMLVEGPMWLQRLWGVYNDQARMQRHRNLIRRMYSVVTGYVTGQLTISGIGATLAGLTVFMLSLFIPGVPSNLALPTMAITFTLSLIPMFGATIAGVVISLLLALNNPTAGVIFAVYFIVYQQIENNFISPTIQSRKLELSALTVLASVTVGLYVFGLAGGIISIPVAGCLKVLLEDYLERARENRKKNDRPLARVVNKLKSEA